MSKNKMTAIEITGRCTSIEDFCFFRDGEPLRARKVKLRSTNRDDGPAHFDLIVPIAEDDGFVELGEEYLISMTKKNRR